jgi:hypothetical protein
VGRKGFRLKEGGTCFEKLCSRRIDVAQSTCLLTRGSGTPTKGRPEALELKPRFQV